MEARMVPAEKVGIVAMPMIFGSSLSFQSHLRELRKEGYHVRVCDPYRGQSFRRPFFLPLVLGDLKTQRTKVNALAKRFRYRPLAVDVSNALGYLRTRERIFLLGFGLGAGYLLKAAEGRERVNGVIGWYPHLIYPEGFSETPPNFTRITCPVMLFFGEKDDRIEPGTLALARGLPERFKNVEGLFYPNVGHAFADHFVQYFFPSPLYNERAAKDSWREALAKIRQWRTIT